MSKVKISSHHFVAELMDWLMGIGLLRSELNKEELMLIALSSVKFARSVIHERSIRPVKPCRCRSKMSPHGKSARGEIITDLICLLLLKYCRWPHLKSLPTTWSPPEKSSPADNLPAKIRPARAAAGRADFCRGRLFAGDPVMGHRQGTCRSLLRISAREIWRNVTVFTRARSGCFTLATSLIYRSFSQALITQDIHSPQTSTD